MPIPTSGGSKFALFIVMLAATPLLGGCYLSHVAEGQFNVLTSTISLKAALQDPTLSDEDKDKLRYIQEVKAFAETELHLKKTCNYSTYLPGPKEPLTYSVSASKKDDLTPYTWWYPIVGKASYKGFFDEALAEEERDRLLAEGYDVYLRGSGAYSTLGWFCDPILPTMLRMDEGRLADLIIHELTHATIYVRGETGLNESLAEFVAAEGAPQFLDKRFGKDNPYAPALRKRQAGKDAINLVLADLADRLKILYIMRPADWEIRRGIEFGRTKREIARLCTDMAVSDSLCDADAQLDNAVVLARLTYGSPEPFVRLFASVGRDWKQFFASLQAQYAPDDWYPPY